MGGSFVPPGPIGNSHLSHYGVKGQQWGVRRTRSDGRVVTNKKTGAKLPVSKEAQDVQAIIARGKSHTKAVLSNKELQDVITRKGLEDRFTVANENKATKFAKSVLNNQGNQKANSFVSETINTATKKKKSG